MPRINDGRRRTSDVEDSGDEQNEDSDAVSAENNSVKDFKSLMLREEILQGLEASGYLKPSPVQARAIPLGTFGADLIVQAKSGTGKTCMFAVIVLQSVLLEYRAPQALIVSPTRELAHQTRDVMTAIGRFLPGLGCTACVGGIATEVDVAALEDKEQACHVVTGTPGRVRALVEMGVLRTEGVRQVVLDEVDVLLDAEFKPQVEQLLGALPARRQTLAVSATFSPPLLALLRASLHQPQFVSLVKASAALKGVRHFYLRLPDAEGAGPLARQRLLEARGEALLELLDGCAFHQAVVFTSSRAHGLRLAQVLDGVGYASCFVHGQQPQAERLAAIGRLRRFEIRVLVSSDLTARGIDVDRVNLVVNLDFPPSPETYLHRVGRTGRYGTYGVAVTLVEAGQEEALQAMAQALGVPIDPKPAVIPRELYEVEVGAGGEEEAEEAAQLEAHAHRRHQTRAALPDPAPLLHRLLASAPAPAASAARQHPSAAPPLRPLPTFSSAVGTAAAGGWAGSGEGGGEAGGGGRDLGCLRRGVAVTVAWEEEWREGWVLGKGARPAQFWVQLAPPPAALPQPPQRVCVDVELLWRAPAPSSACSVLSGLASASCRGAVVRAGRCNSRRLHAMNQKRHLHAHRSS